MICFRAHLRFLFYLTLSTSTCLANVGTVVFKRGEAFSLKGEIQFPRPEVGQSIKVNDFGQYRGKETSSFTIKPNLLTYTHFQKSKTHPPFENSTPFHVPHTCLQEETLYTLKDGYLKLVFQDRSLVSVGPESIFQVPKLIGTDTTREFHLKLALGSTHHIIPRLEKQNSIYHIDTPTALIKVYKTGLGGVAYSEFLVRVSQNSFYESRTEILGLHGQLHVEVTKLTTHGLVYLQPFVINRGVYLTADGPSGIGAYASFMDTLKVKDIKGNHLFDPYVLQLSPHVNLQASAFHDEPRAEILPGTGVALNLKIPNTEPKEKENALEEISPAPRSYNFKKPKDLKLERIKHSSCPSNTRIRNSSGPC